MKICNIVGARPNFIKMAPLVAEFSKRRVANCLVHTGQHFDDKMSGSFFRELGMPKPDYFLGISGGSHANQTAEMMKALEGTFTQVSPDVVVVAGDVNSTLAAALVASKMGIPLVHVEAGLRSFDRGMPEEINRILTDHVSELLLTTEASGQTNLLREGIDSNKIRFVGNCMIDSLVKMLSVARDKKPWQEFGLKPKEYTLLTLHRPANVDDDASFDRLLLLLKRISSEMPVIFPVHPRTQKKLESVGASLSNTVKFCEPQPYVSFLGLMAEACFVLTDSGGVQEETTFLKTPCFTLRHNTERPVTVTMGTNRIIGDDHELLFSEIHAMLKNGQKASEVPPLWDGKAAVRSVDAICERFG